MQPVYELRSDTMTMPTAAMRAAIAEAPVGDDVFGEDPTVGELEALVAEILGKEAALLTPSGTMANQLAVRSQTQPGDEMFVENGSHIYFYEAGAAAALSGVTCRTLQGDRGRFDAEELLRHVRPRDQHFPRPRLVVVENTHNRGGGSVWPLRQLAEVVAAARARGLSLHMDGARLWHAAEALGRSEREVAEGFDTVSVCFSKALGAPIGSALAGPRDTIARARGLRKQFGGGMRMAGIVAAGALHAVRHHRDRLREDHDNARLLAQLVKDATGKLVDVSPVETNIVLFRQACIPAEELVVVLWERGVRVLATGPDEVRAVACMRVDADAIRIVASIVASAIVDAA